MTIKNDDEHLKRIDICRQALQEGMTVLKKAEITAASTNGTEDSPEMMLLKFDDALALAEGVGQGMLLHNSTWQSLAKKKKVMECDWYTGKIIELGRKHHVPTPYNCAIFYYQYQIAERELGPESVEVEKIIKKAHACD